MANFNYKRTSSKYSQEQNSEFAVRAMTVLNENEEALTIDQIRNSDLMLLNVTPQKMAKVLNEMVESGFVQKTKNKSGKMIYKSVAAMVSQGYEV